MAYQRKYCHILPDGARIRRIPEASMKIFRVSAQFMNSRFVIHHHKTGRSHFDLRMIEDGIMRSWSLLRQPPLQKGDRRLAIERESFSPQAMDSKGFMESAFGAGKVHVWDEGEVEIEANSARLLTLVFRGKKLDGRYELSQMRWYPGNHWILKKTADSNAKASSETSQQRPAP
jgi:bifunctional non-homologous end joining protein LigD